MSLFNIYFPNRLEQFWRDIILRFVEISLNTYLSGKPAYAKKGSDLFIYVFSHLQSVGFAGINKKRQ